MLSKPNVNDLMEKSGNRYESVIAIAKRARQIERRRMATNDPCIKDAVDTASKEICEQKSLVKKNGEYVCPIKDEEVDMNTVISETVDGILKDLALDSHSIESEKNESKDSKAVTKLVDEKKTKIKKVAKAVTNEEE